MRQRRQVGELRRVAARTLAALAPYDAVLTPTLAVPPLPVGAIRDDEDPAGDFEAQKRFTPYTSMWNVTGSPAATTGQEALDQLGGAVAVYLEDGPRGGGVPSTIVDCTRDEPVVLRLGALSAEELRAVLGTTVLHDAPPSVTDAPAATGARLVGSVVPSGVAAPAGSLRTLAP